MNHPSEWTRYYDAPQGTYRYKHKGTGVVRDTLMAIGRRFKKQATKEKARQALKRAVEKASKQMLKNATEKAAEKGAEKIQAVLRGSKKTPLSTESRQKLEKMLTKSSKLSGIQAVLRGSKKTPLSTESRQKLEKMLTKSSKLSGDSRKKLNQILNPGRAAKLKVNQYLAEN